MRTLTELINTEEPGIELIHEWIADAVRPVEILPLLSKEIAEEALLELQVTTRSPLGAIAYDTGGILIDNGWVRVLGGGMDIFPSICQWNKGKTMEAGVNTVGYYIVAYDLLGGYFCINGGGLGQDAGSIYYFAPDTLNFEALDINYTDLIIFFITGNLEQFYQDFRWNTWKEDTAELALDKALHIYPPLWTKEGKNIDSTSLAIVPAEDIYHINKDFRNGLNDIENKYK
ncbi:DUF2625 family protein [Myroides sp. N17-2]|uniref:DUF2625 family protein n=1 Tax=Myroides sp. N17-2 TaxID=2030799 RepID=UPI000EFD583C|nr:DUF2625 family protein [Myroides sp. N17-2]